MEYERLSNRLFYALKYNIVLQGSYFTSNGFLVCCSIVILLIIKVLCIVMFKGFKGVGVYSVVMQEITRLQGGVVVVVVYKVVVVVWIVWYLVGWVVDRVWMVGE